MVGVVRINDRLGAWCLFQPDALSLMTTAGRLEYPGESATHLEHAIEAATLAHVAGESDALTIAAFFHDIGHLIAIPGLKEMPGLGVAKHEIVGARYLDRIGYSHLVVDLVRFHVAVKKYLVYRTPNYLESLSSGSLGTLAHEGGPMRQPEAEAFEQHYLFRDLIRLRGYDDAAKCLGGLGMEPLPLSLLSSIIRRHLANPTK
jgi:2-amino-1-hydroxyethylphosphonate dioxygenase (glycine-forming)